MLFNSLDFAVFLPIVFALYWLLKDKLNYQNLLILLASYIFYAWWDWKFLILILISTLTDYTLGIKIQENSNYNRRKLYLYVSLFVNLGILFLFKYYNFFIDNLEGAFTIFGCDIDIQRLDIILPVGISFYTFQTLSYTIDVYRGNLKASRNILEFSSFVSFFPQLVAGPIERAKHLLPQFAVKRRFLYPAAVDGLRQMLWGLFKKVVIADNSAVFVNNIFSEYEIYNSQTLIIGAVLFAFQIYCDFSGYSDIAIGVSRLFGFDLRRNFAFPYFSRDIAEFWRRWHISLSSWFRDYVYIPLGGSRVNMIKQVRNTFIIFLVSGFWHGANWTYIFWGLLNAIYFLPLMVFKRNRKNIAEVDKISVRSITKILYTFLLTCIAWIFFRSKSIEDAFGYLFKMATNIGEKTINNEDLYILFILIVYMLGIEWYNRKSKHGLDFSQLNISKFSRHIFYLTTIILIISFAGSQQDFIYFQF